MNGNIGQGGYQPIFILPEGTGRTKGRDAQTNNIAAAKLVADTVKTTLGPKGMDKMLVDSLGDITITNDGVTILEEMQIEHPAAKMMVEVAKAQNEAVGDGTTTAVVLAGELLKKAGELLEQDIHPIMITKGFKLAKERAVEVLEKYGVDVTMKDEKALAQIANTAMTGKSAERASDYLSNLCVQAAKKVSETENGRIIVDTDNIKIEKKHGGSISDTMLIDGILIDKEVVHSGMPKMLRDARIALIDAAMEVKELEGDAKISIDSPEKMQAFMNEEENMIKKIVSDVANSGANVVLCQKGIDDMVQHFLSKKGVMAARRVKKSDMEKLAMATGAKIVSNISELSKTDLGAAGNVEERKVGTDRMIFVEKCKQPKAVTILIRGGTEHVVDEVERALEDAIRDIAATLELGKLVPGGGASEIEISRALRKYAESFSGREQLAVLAFADAIEVIPRVLAENSGLDPIDKLAMLRAEHEKGKKSSGLNVFTGRVIDMHSEGVVEPLKIKLQAVKSATEAAEMILRIDDIIASSGGSGGAGGMPPMPPGGGMPGMM
ncbi:MAG: TCP-1/cpn60 chaperonin family protein [Candidatus Aenigmarchaeota archaeon]|nr:TCP-1/cpn60 chaperonin family protein [Candidatus Aenigmarchaeota archaeon]